jgi:putative transmembrane mobilisation protein
MLTKETAAYRPILILTDFANEEGENMMGEEIKANYDWINTETRDIVQRGWQ